MDLATPVPDGEATDTLSARIYGHPVLGDRRVVRLAADTLGPAEDLSLEFLGFHCASTVGPLARTRRRALGFPAWALVNDPAHGRTALALVKDLEGLSRLARAKPGNARAAFEQLGDRLAREVPHFLPTFFEEAGRAFLDAGIAQSAAVMFGRAREAERTYALEVDEDRRREVFLEFALAGALPARALDEYADQLLQAHPPADAYAIYRDLCLQRTLGGLPPGAGMSRQLYRLARAARLDTAQASELLLQRLLEAPAIREAPGGFWSAYRAALIGLANGSAHIRSRLLDLFPSPLKDAPGFDDWWLQLLDDCGALDALCAPVSEAMPPGSVARWLEQLMATRAARGGTVASQRVRAFLPRLAARLIADGVPVDLYGGRWRARADLDLVDAALELGIPLASPQRLSLRLPKTRTDRDLTYVFADPDWRPVLERALEAFFAQGGHADALPPVPGLRQLVAGWLDHCADTLEQGGLPQITDVLKRLTTNTSAHTLALNPVAAERLALADLARALGRTLRGGLLDELGWPALDEAVARFSAGRPRIAYAWPHVILYDASRALAVGPEAILIEHDLRPPPPVHGVPERVTFAEDGLQLMWRQGADLIGYRSNRPSEVLSVRARGIDGAAPDVQLPSMMSLPGDDRPRPLTQTVYQVISLWAPDGVTELFRGAAGTPGGELAAGTGIVPPLVFWQSRRPRDVAGSHALRACDDARARRLLDAAVADLGGANATRDVLARELPAVSHPRLKDGIIGVALAAARLIAQRDAKGYRPT